MAGNVGLKTLLFGWDPPAARSARTIVGVQGAPAPIHVSRQKSPGTTVVFGTMFVAQD